jgi:hypothetical protein
MKAVCPFLIVSQTALTLCIFLITNVLHAQYMTSDDPLDQFVVAFSGIKLREQPDFDSRTIVVLPFGSKVKLTEPFGYETRNICSKDSVFGSFQKAIANGKTGYVFTAYLSKAYYQLDQPIHLFESYCLNDCDAPMISNQYTYYTVNVDPLTNRAWVKKELPVIYFGDACFKNSAQIAFSIATKLPFTSEGEINNSTGSCLTYEQIQKSIVTNTPMRIPHSSFELVCKETMDPEAEQIIKTLWCIEKGTNKKQPLNDKLRWHDQYALVWYGDLDRDGHQDFIISGRGDHAETWSIYLSRDYLKQKEMKPSAVYNAADCC